MADIIIPGTDKILLDGTIVILVGFDDVKYILHNGYYTYNDEMFEGWYGVSIPDQNIIPIVVDMLVGCEVVYYPDSNCNCRFPSGNIPYTTEDDFQLQRAFITVDTMIERDALSPNLSITNLANGKIVRVNKPNNVDFDPKYYIYTYNSDLSGAYWDPFIFYSFPDGGIPKSDLSADVQASLDLADNALQPEDLGSDFETNYETGTISLSEYGKTYTCVLNWLSKLHTSDAYDPEQVESNLLRLATIRNLDNIYQSYWGRHLIYIKMSDKYHPAIIIRDSNNNIIGVQIIAYSDQIQQLIVYTIQGTTISNYTQTQYSILQYSSFDEYSNQGASQYVIAQWIYSLMNVADGIAGLDSNGLVDSSNLPTASSSNLGAVKINQGGLQIAADGTVSIIPGTDIEIDSDTGAINNTYTYELPIASAELLGGIKAGTWISIDQETGAASVVIPANTFDAYGAASAVQSNLDIHTENTTIHVTAQDKTAWGAKYDKPANGIPKTDLTSAVQASLDKADTSIQSVNTTITPDASGNVNITYADVGADAAGTAASEAAIVQGNLDAVEGRVDDIEDVIPNAATAQNQLADKAFVNSSIATNTANFIGTFDSVAQLEAYSGPLTNNDYAFVVQYDSQDPTQVVAYDRYKYTATDRQWLYEYTLNNSSFTAEQWAAINSTITVDLVTAYSAHVANTTIHVTSQNKSDWNAKYDKPSGGIPKSDLAQTVQTSLTAADNAIPSSEKGVAGGVPTLGNDGKIPKSQLPPTVPDGGTSGQVLTKQSNADGDADWDNIPDVNINDVVQTAGDILLINCGTSTTNLADPYPNGNGQSF